MKYYTREVVMPRHLNMANKLFGGQVLSWIDKECAIFAGCQLNTHHLVTAHMGEISFKAPGNLGDVVEIGCEVVKFGRTSITIRCDVRNKSSGKTIVSADDIVFVAIDESGRPVEHGQTEEKQPG